MEMANKDTNFSPFEFNSQEEIQAPVFHQNYFQIHNGISSNNEIENKKLQAHTYNKSPSRTNIQVYEDGLDFNERVPLNESLGMLADESINNIFEKKSSRSRETNSDKNSHR